MAHEHSSGQPVRRSTRQKSSKKTPDFLYLELPGQWQDFNFLDEDLPQPTKQRVVAPEKGSPSVQQAPSASANPARPSNSHNLELEIRVTEVQNQKLALELEVSRLHRADGNAVLVLLVTYFPAKFNQGTIHQPTNCKIPTNPFGDICK